jgi:hypothetical protein
MEVGTTALVGKLAESVGGLVRNTQLERIVEVGAQAGVRQVLLCRASSFTQFLTKEQFTNFSGRYDASHPRISTYSPSTFF